MSTPIEIVDLLKIIKWFMLLFLGMLVAYYRTNGRLQSVIGNLIAQAEKTYGEANNGGIKFRWVFNKVYSMVPIPLNAIITKQMVEGLVQSTFDVMAAYAKIQLDKLLDSTMPDIERTED